MTIVTELIGWGIYGTFLAASAMLIYAFGRKDGIRDALKAANRPDLDPFK